MMEHDYPGSRWWKFDFHNHTPASSDFDPAEIGTLQPRDWLLAYMRKGIDCVAVTDHNSSDWIEKLQRALNALNSEEPKPQGYHPLILFPGVEITTAESLHMLALFGPETTKAQLDGLLRGRLSFTNSDKKNAEWMCQQSAVDVVIHIHAMQGLAIAAHVEKDNGLLQDGAGSTAFTPKHPGRLIEDVLAKVDALEFQSLDIGAYRHFEQRIEPLALVSGSDWPHKSSNAGSRFTWIKMSKPSFEGLRLALLDPESAVRRSDRYPNDPQPLPHQWIQSITLENMHLRRNAVGPLTLKLNPAYNAVIGGRGSGKSTVLECMRLALARDNELELLSPNSDAEICKTFEGFKREYSQRDKPGMMLPDTQISLEMVRGRGETSERLRYLWSKQADGKFATHVFRWEEDRWHATALNEQQAREHFPVKIFSQKQILALANHPQALLGYIDDSIRDKKAAWQQQFETCKSKLLAVRLRVRTLKKELEKKPALELEYKEVSRKARVFANANFGPLLKAYQRATQQQRAMDDFYHLLDNDVAALHAGLAQAANLAGTELTQFLAETPAEIAALNNALALKNTLVAQYQQVAAIVSAMEEQLENAKAAQKESDWIVENHAHVQAYQRENERLKAEGINSAQEASLAIAAEERLRKQLEQIKTFEVALEGAEQAVQVAAQELTVCREALTRARESFIQKLFAQNDMLQVSLRSMGNARGAADSFRQLLRLDGTARFEDVWLEGDTEGQGNSGMLWDMVDPQNTTNTIGERLMELKMALEERSKKVLNTELHGKLHRRIEVLPHETFNELSWWFPEDEVMLSYRPKKGASYKNIVQASAGQKTAAMLSFLLVHGDEPLLLDQPEDDLDNALVSELVVEQLRKNKARRQLLVVTHNANIVVNADAELVTTMGFNGQIICENAGGLQERKVREDVCRVMEGGKEAFQQRYKRILEDLETKP